MFTPKRGPVGKTVCAAALVVFLIALGARVARSQSPTYGLGRTPAPAEITAWDISIPPDGTGLPPGSGSAAEGKTIYTARCVECHGATGKEGPEDIIVGGQGSLATATPLKTVGSFWPYATTLWDYVNRAMPFDRPGTLSADQVYALVAYLLHLNGIVGEQDRLDAKTLPQVKMPNRDGFVPDSRPDTGRPVTPRKPTR